MSSVEPASIMRGNREAFGIYPNERNFNRFPGWLGKNSTHGKNKRLLLEVHSHALSVRLGRGCSSNLHTIIVVCVIT